MAFIGNVIGFVFSRTGLVFGVIIGLMAVLAGFHYLNDNRLGWKAGSEYYQARALKADTLNAKLTGDTVRLFARAVRFQLISDTLKQQASDAVVLASQYRSDRDAAIALSDQQTDKLTIQQKQVAYLRALMANKTLSTTYPTSGTAVDLASDAVLDAGLKTANREAIVSEKAADLEMGISTLKSQITDLKNERDGAVSSSLYAENVLVKRSQRRPVREWLKSKRKQAARDAKAVREARIDPNQVSDLEKELNQ